MDNNRFLHKVTRSFPSSLSCRLRNTPDVVTKKTPHENDLNDPLFKKTEQESKINPTLVPLHRRRLGKFSQGKKSPHLPKLNNQKHKGTFSVSSSNSGLFTSSDENTTFFSLSSDYSHERSKELKRIDDHETEQAKKQQSNATCPVYHELGFDQISTQIYYSKEKTRRDKSALIEGCCAVEKSSNDPYGDFRASMVETIMAKQMFGAENLERLLSCFLSLNSDSYHGIIIHVFDEICHTLFSY